MRGEASQVFVSLINLPPSCKARSEARARLGTIERELTLVELGSHLRIEESLIVQDIDKPKGNNVAGPSVVNMYHKTADCYGINSQSDYSLDGCEDSFLECKFDESDKGVIICLDVDDMLIFGTGQVQVDLTKEFLSSRFSMKDVGEVDVILGIRIKHENNGIAIFQSHYIEKVLKKFNYFDCTPISTPMDTSEKLMPNNGQAVSQLEYSRVIGCLMYAMTCTRPDIAFAVGKLSRYTSNPGTQHWQAIQRVLKYLKKTIDYKLTYTGYPLVLEALICDSDATLTKAYSQMHNGKSRHLGVRHIMIRELITNGVVSIEFVRSQQNLVDYLTKGLARDLVIKSTEGMRLKSN
ncbi:zinc finger, CCHC-type containing protein [Tanacetum coccineum]